jgi:pimeloyl-ACP methyl ester carboxylesterase
MWSDGDLEELEGISGHIDSTETWVSEFVKLADHALQEDQVNKAIAYYRMAEFFEFDGSCEKIKLYRKSREYFYEKNSFVFNSVLNREYVDYQGIKLPVWTNKLNAERSRSTVVIHGGNDSYIEEFLPIMLYFSGKDIKVYLFEGPGQGEVLREFGMSLICEWEKPVSRILDHYKLDDVTIIGISLGGMLASRAAAFEKRIKRVVSWSILPNFLDVLLSTRNRTLQKTLRALLYLRCKNLINFLMKKQIKKDPMAKWEIYHGLHNMGVNTFYDYLLKADKFQMLDVAELITQDYLLIGAKKDHFIPVEMYKAVVDSLVNVSSMTYRLFTEKECGENHCNAGNTGLVLDTIVDWIVRISEK